MYFTDSLLSNSSNDFSSNAALCGVTVRTYSSYNYNLKVDLVYSDVCGLFLRPEHQLVFEMCFSRGNFTHALFVFVLFLFILYEKLYEKLLSLLPL